MGPVYKTFVDLGLKDDEVVINSISASKTSITAVSFLSGPAGPPGPAGSAGPAGPQGVKGDTGPQGNAGIGVASGGNTNQFLTKNSNTNYDTGWVDITQATVGLANVNNTADVDKPVSTATQAVFDTKVDITDSRLTDQRTPLDSSVTDAKVASNAAIAISKLEVDPRLRSTHTGTQSADTIVDGTNNKVYTAAEKTKLGTVASGATANSSDATLLNRANHTGTQTASTISDFNTAADTRITAQKGVASGLATLDDTGKVTSSQVPAAIDEVVEYATFTDLPASGSTAKIYITTDDNKQYRWSGTQYIEIISSPGTTDAVPEGTTNLYFTTSRAAAAAPVQTVNGSTGTVVLTKTSIGLANVDNTSDLSKPVSTATQSAIDATKNQLIGMIIALG